MLHVESVLLLVLSHLLTAQAVSIRANVTPLSFESVGDAGISAQQMFLGTLNKVYILDKTENNPVNVTGKYGTHPAWAVEYDIDTNEYRVMDVDSNTFCAGGSVLGNGTWAVFGGNQPVTTGGVATTNEGVYHDTDGGTAIRLLDPCDDESCSWLQGDQPFNTYSDVTGGFLQMTGARWYPTIETMVDGSVIVIGGDKNGGYVSTTIQNNPTFEFFPPRGNGSAIYLDFLARTVPTNLFPLTWLMPSGNLFMQANRSTIMYNLDTYEETELPAMPFSVRVYPGSAATTMLPLTPADNYTATILFCGGSNPPQWGTDGGPGFNITAVPADNSCVRISPDQENPQYEVDDYMFEGRSMGQFVILPDGTLWHGNGVGMGTAGYGNNYYSVGQSFGQNPTYMPSIYNYTAPAGSRFNRTGLTASANERMYHSTAILLPDSSVFISGSNPNADFTNAQWRSRTDTERWYPWYYNEPRPEVTSAPTNLTYGGDYFQLDLVGQYDENSMNTAKVVVHRNGFNTHAMGFGQRMIELRSSYIIHQNGSCSLFVQQLPNPGPTLFQPGPAVLFVVIDGVPSLGSWVMVGSGQIEPQNIGEDATLPESTVVTSQSQSATSNSSTTTNEAASPKSAAMGVHDLPFSLSVSLALGLCAVLAIV